MKKNPLKQLFYTLVNPWKKFPDSSTIDQSGTVKSDHPKPGNGWMKGWVVDVEPRNVVIICRHANPSTKAPNNKVFVVDKDGVKHERCITAIDKDPFLLDGTNIPHEYYMSSDIAICRLDSPLPDSIKAYNIAVVTDPHKFYKQKMVTFDQDGNKLISSIHFRDCNFAYITGSKRNRNRLVSGDSGMPWFVWDDNKWKVISHTFRGVWGEGPWYGHPNIYLDIMKRIKKLQG